jgi:hypothetical protein
MNRQNSSISTMRSTAGRTALGIRLDSQHPTGTADRPLVDEKRAAGGYF